MCRLVGSIANWFARSKALLCLLDVLRFAHWDHLECGSDLLNQHELQIRLDHNFSCKAFLFTSRLNITGATLYPQMYG